MLTKKIILVFSISLIGLQVAAQETYKFPFLNPSSPVAERVSDLVERMTLQEKLSQLFNHSPAIERLDIPAYDWWNEGLHGVARAGKATVFPQAIALAATFDEPLMYDVASAISDEARAKHNYFLANNVHSIYTGLTFWSPNINIFRDPRWGRGQETYGEDPFLTGRMAVQFIKGLQGNDSKYLKTIATAKHYAVHSGPEFSRHQDNIYVNDRDLFETYLPAFKAAVREANVQSVMCAYNRFRDQPCCGSNLLLSNILRNQFGFKGYVVSDCGAVSDFYNPNSHHVVETSDKAWGWSISAGTDINCEESKGFINGNIDSSVNAGIINENDIDRSVMRLFRARFLLGMFDPKDMVSYNQIPVQVIGCKKNTALSLRAAEESIVLLKNNGILPLKKNIKIGLIGPNANNMLILLGNYNGSPIDPVTPLKGLTRLVGESNIYYSPGCAIMDCVFTNFENIPATVLFHQSNGKLMPGLVAEYFSDTILTAHPVKTQVDSIIKFYWKTSPTSGKVEDIFSVRWKGMLIPAVSGLYSFGGNVRIKINDKIVESGTQKLEAGQQYKIEAAIVIQPFWWGNTVEPTADLTWVNTSIDYEQEALDIAKKSDVVIFCGGISSQLEGEEMPLETKGFAHGDRTDIDLPEMQELLLKRLRASGKKLVYINFSGSAIAFNWAKENADAILQVFYPGEKGGEALANILLGITNPSGRLPVTFYKSVNDLPPFKDYAMKGRTYRYFTGKPLFPFGFGMSYTSFEYKDLKTPKKLRCGDSLYVSVQVTNTGKMDGNEVVEIYLKRRENITGEPLISLVSFKKIFLRAGESKTVYLNIFPDQLAIFDQDNNMEVRPGEISLVLDNRMSDEFDLAKKGKFSHPIVLYGSTFKLK